MTWRNALDFQVLCGVSRKLENLSGEVFQHGGEVDSCLGTNASLLAGNSAKVALYATAWELCMTRLVPRHTRIGRVVVLCREAKDASQTLGL
jgi:hypothetical protein